MFDPGSFRDPAGRILDGDGEVLRAVFAPGAAAYEQARDAGTYRRAVETGRLLGVDERDPALLAGLQPPAHHVLAHPRIGFVSYPYEWGFSGLRAAALLHLDFHLDLLAEGFTLSDATAYNVQFQGTRPVFIDHLSVVPYEEGALWAGQRQFGMQFLNPLLLWARRGIAPNPWFRGTGEGIPPEDLAALLRLRDKLSFTVLAHVVAPARLHQSGVRRGSGAAPASRRRLSKNGLVAILRGLRDFIAGLSYPGGATVWSGYAERNSYDEAQRCEKHDFVREAIGAVQPKLVFDIGCNSGDFTRTALDAGAGGAIGFDYDFGALEKAFSRFDKDGANVLPLWLDAANPSPAQGWAGAERKGLAERGGADALLALAVVHHLAIGRNVPLEMAVDWLMSHAPTGIIEFPSKRDAMVQELLSTRPDIFPDYTEEAFLAFAGRRAAIVAQRRLGENGRLLIQYDRRR